MATNATEYELLEEAVLNVRKANVLIADIKRRVTALVERAAALEQRVEREEQLGEEA